MSGENNPETDPLSAVMGRVPPPAPEISPSSLLPRRNGFTIVQSLQSRLPPCCAIALILTQFHCFPLIAQELRRVPEPALKLKAVDDRAAVKARVVEQVRERLLQRRVEALPDTQRQQQIRLAAPRKTKKAPLSFKGARLFETPRANVQPRPRAALRPKATTAKPSWPVQPAVADGVAAGLPVNLCQECNAVPLTCGEPVSDTLNGEECTNADNSFVDVFTLELTEARDLDLRLVATDFDPILSVANDACELLASNDDCTPGDRTTSCLALPLSPGRYFIAVSSFDAASTGSYTLESTCTEIERCSRCEPTTLACDGMSEGALNDADCAAPSDGVQDLYRIELAEASRIAVEVTSEQFDTVLTLLDEFCIPLAENDDCIAFDSTRSCLNLDLPAGSYLLAVSAFSPEGRGNYQISATCLPGFDLCSDCTVGSIGCDESVSGEFPGVQCVVGDGQNIEFYTFSAPAANVFDVSLSSEDFDTIIAVFDSNCEIIAVNDDCSVDTLNSCLQDLQLAAGDYLIGVTSFDPGEAGAYDLTVSCADARLCIDCSVEPLTCGGSVTAEITSESCAREEGGRVAIHPLELAELSALEVTLKTEIESASLSLLSASCEVIATGAPCGDDVCIQLPQVDPGQYSIMVSTADGAVTGSYELTAECPPFNPCEECGDSSIACGEAKSANLTDAPCRLADGTPFEVYRLELEETNRVSIELSSASFDTFLFLLDANCIDIGANDDCGPETTDSCLEEELPAGVYYVVANSFEGPGGDYDLRVECGGISTCADCSAGTLACGFPIAGRLPTSGCALDGGAFLDVYDVTLTEETTVRVELRSTEFDPILVLFNSDCVAGEFNDDCEPGNLELSCLTVTLSAGTHFFGVTSFDPGLSGAYTLELTAPDCDEAGSQLPGDLTQDGMLDAADGMLLIRQLFDFDRPTLPCADGAGLHPANAMISDFNGSGRVDISDAVSMFVYLLRDGPPHALGADCVDVPACPEVAECAN